MLVHPLQETVFVYTGRVSSDHPQSASSCTWNSGKQDRLKYPCLVRSLGRMCHTHLSSPKFQQNTHLPQGYLKVSSCSKMANLSEGTLFGMGNPLLDIAAEVDPEYLQKYEMKPNDAILAEDKHQPMYKEMVDKYQVQYTAGGSVQNTFRVAQWILGQPNIVTFMGAVGADEFGKVLEREAVADGVNVQYQIVENQPTGTCAVLLTEKNRSLCANLAAANHFTKDHLDKEKNMEYLQKASFYYISGFFLTVSPESIMAVAKHAADTNRPFAMNLSAPFILQFFSERFQNALPYIDLLFGNETEARAFSEMKKLGTTEVREIALKALDMPKVNTQRPRIVIFTQGSDPVIVAENGSITEIPVVHLNADLIKDTNGAGDAFVGGFLAKYIQGESLPACVRCGIWAATEVIQRSGCTFPKDKIYTCE